MVTTVVKVKVKHVFDVRSEIAIRDIKRGISKRQVRCLKCKQLVKDPSSSCSRPINLGDIAEARER
jgi:hypothetical protein